MEFDLIFYTKFMLADFVISLIGIKWNKKGRHLVEWFFVLFNAKSFNLPSSYIYRFFLSQNRISFFIKCCVKNNIISKKTIQNIIFQFICWNLLCNKTVSRYHFTKWHNFNTFFIFTFHRRTMMMNFFHHLCHRHQ